MRPPRPRRKPLREDEVNEQQSKVSSIARGRSRTCANRRRSRARSRDGFPRRSGAQRPFMRRCCAALLALACCLRTRPPSLCATQIGWNGVRTLLWVQRCLTTSATKRLRRTGTPRASDPRRAVNARLFWSHIVLRVCPRFPRDSFRRRTACDSPSLSRQAGSEPPKSIALPPTGAASLPTGWTTKAAALRSAACGRHYEPSTGCADRRLKRRQRVVVGRTAWSKGPPLAPECDAARRGG